MSSFFKPRQFFENGPSILTTKVSIIAKMHREYLEICIGPDLCPLRISLGEFWQIFVVIV
jgi:hypothetical protein